MSSAPVYFERDPYFGPSDELFRWCLIGSSICGVLFLVAVLLAPIRREVITSIEQLPPRFAKLIVAKPKPLPEVATPVPAAPGTTTPDDGTPPPETGTPEAEAPPGPGLGSPGPPRPPGGEPGLPPGTSGTGAAGRARAQAAVSGLAKSTQALERSLGKLTSSLQTVPAGAASATTSGRRARGVRSGRSAAQLGGVKADLAGGGEGVDLSGSGVSGGLVSIGNLSAFAGSPYAGGGGGGGVGGGPGGSGSGGTGSGGGAIGGSGYGSGGSGGGGSGGGGAAPGAYRSNASLLAVVHKYSAGIHYCYANELKHDEKLRGKLVVAMTVAASGQVVEATIVENTLGSSRLAACALSQIRDWKFPPIEKGLTSFQAPFVFTPPN